ncbi:DUF3560 domain-containing protein [Streptomyces violascens]|uniref:DUF3560 domain-containing protein n=1 Tax=Streptomyces violascens TaxID=67381 RepID=UPI0036AC5E26
MYEIIRPFGFRFFPSLGCLGLPRSRDKQAMTWKINPAAAALRDQGFEVTVSIDEDTRRSFAEAEAERVERAEARAERFDERAGRAGANSKALHASAHRLADSIPFGQPILIGHHSERRARRDQERIHNTTGKAIAEGERSSYWAGRAAASGSYEQFRNNPRRTLRRLEKLRGDLRRVKRWQKGQSADGYTRDVSNPDTVAELNRRHEELTEEITYWEELIKKAEEDGFKVWSKADFKKGDFVRRGGTWFEVLRVNAKSLTIPHIHNGVGERVVRASGIKVVDWTWLLTYDEVFGRSSAEEIEAALAAAAPQ